MLDRNLAEAHAQIGLAKQLMGREAETETHIREAFRLSPRDVFGYRWLAFIGSAKLLLNEDAEALVWLRRSVEANRNYPIAHFALAAALALIGSLDQARAAAKAGLALNPGFAICRFREGMCERSPNLPRHTRAHLPRNADGGDTCGRPVSVAPVGLPTRT